VVVDDLSAKREVLVALLRYKATDCPRLRTAIRDWPSSWRRIPIW
jgi:hypothetical protein